MKERIVIKDKQAIDEWNRTIACYVDIDNSIYKAKFEKVPETFKDLKELCKDIKGIEFAGGTAKGEIIELDNIWFAENGDIWGYTDNCEEVCVIGKKRTPAQMWAIIKSLISGEE